MGLRTIEKLVSICMDLLLDIFVTARQDRYALMWGLKPFDNIIAKFSTSVSSGGSRPLP